MSQMIISVLIFNEPPFAFITNRLTFTFSKRSLEIFFHTYNLVTFAYIPSNPNTLSAVKAPTLNNNFLTTTHSYRDTVLGHHYTVERNNWELFNTQFRYVQCLLSYTKTVSLKSLNTKCQMSQNGAVEVPNEHVTTDNSPFILVLTTVLPHTFIGCLHQDQSRTRH